MKKVIAVTISLAALVLAAQWQSLNGPPAGRADDMSMGSYEGQWVIYAADQTHKLYKSTNEGEYWDSITYLEVTKNPACVITAPTDAQVVYIGRYDAVPVWWSQDGGQTWEQRSGTPPNNITNPNPFCFAMDPNNSSIVYLGCRAAEDTSVLFRTTDGGREWRSLNLSGYDINDILALNLLNEGIILVLATNKGILRSQPYDYNTSPHPSPPPHVGRDKGRGAEGCDVYFSFRLVKEGEFELLKYDQRENKIFAKGVDKIWQSDNGKKWKIYQSNEPVDFFGVGDMVKHLRK